MTENEIAKIIVDVAFQVHKRLGPGLLETVYEVILAHEVYDDIKFDEGFVEKISRVHKKQLLTYLRLGDKRLGLLINFGSELIRDGISRVVNGLKD